MKYRRVSMPELVRWARRIAREGLVIGPAGNISVRRGAAMVIKASGVWLERACPADFVSVPIAGPPRAEGRNPSCEYRLHAACYQNRPDIACVLHTHPVYATLAVSMGISLRSVLPEMILGIGTEPGIVRYHHPGTKMLARAVGRCAAAHNVVYMKNHGLVAVGASPEEAYLRTRLAEQLAQIHITAALLSRRVSPANAAALRRCMKRSSAARHSS